MLRAGQARTVPSVAGRDKIFLCSLMAGPKLFCSKSNEEFFRGAQRSSSNADQSRPSSNKVKNAWSPNSILILVHMVTIVPYFVRLIQNTSEKTEFLNVKVTGKYIDRCPTEG